VLAYTLIDIVGYLISIVVTLVIIQFVMAMLLQFNVINFHNNFVRAAWQAVNALLEPILAPVRRIMPDTGAIDFSPMVLIIGLTILQKVLYGLAMASVQ
jgi:YggT family protein